MLLAGCSTQAESLQGVDTAKAKEEPTLEKQQEPVVQEPEAAALPERDGATIANFRKALKPFEELNKYELEDRETDEGDKEAYPGLIAQAIFKNHNVVSGQDEFWLFEFSTVEEAQALYEEDVEFWGEAKTQNRSFTNGYLVLRVLNKDSDHLELYKKTFMNLTP